MLALSGMRTHGYVAKWLKIMMSRYLMIQGEKKYKKQAASAKPHVSNQNILKIVRSVSAVFWYEVTYD